MTTIGEHSLQLYSSLDKSNQSTIFPVICIPHDTSAVLSHERLIRDARLVYQQQTVQETRTRVQHTHFDKLSRHLTSHGVKKIVEFHPFRQIFAMVLRANHLDSVVLHDLNVAQNQGPWFPLGGLQAKEQVDVTCISWSILGYLAVGGRNGVTLWKLSLHPPGAKPSNNRPNPINLEWKQGNFGNVSSLSWSPDGKTLAAGCTHTDAIFLWDVTSLQPQKLISGVGGPTLSVQYSPGAFMVSEFNPSPPSLGQKSLSNTIFSTLQQQLLKTSRLDPITFEEQHQSLSTSGNIPLPTQPGSGTFLFQTCSNNLARMYETTLYTHRNMFLPTISEATWIPNVSPPMMLYISQDEPQKVQVWMMKTDGSDAWINNNAPMIGMEKMKGLDVNISVESLAMDPTGQRLALLCQGQVILYTVKTRALAVDFTLIGKVVGPLDAKALCVTFAKQYSRGALLTILWDSDITRMTFVPCHF